MGNEANRGRLERRQETFAGAACSRTPTWQTRGFTNVRADDERVRAAPLQGVNTSHALSLRWPRRRGTLHG